MHQTKAPRAAALKISNSTKSLTLSTVKRMSSINCRSRASSQRSFKAFMLQFSPMARQVLVRLIRWRVTSARSVRVMNELVKFRWVTRKMLDLLWEPSTKSLSRLKLPSAREPSIFTPLSCRSTTKKCMICSTLRQWNRRITKQRKQASRSDGVRLNSSQLRTYSSSDATMLSMRFRCITRVSRTRLWHHIIWTLSPVEVTPFSLWRWK